MVFSQSAVSDWRLTENGPKDCDWCRLRTNRDGGVGKEMCGALEALLMAKAGRTGALEKLDGPGAGVLVDLIRNPSKVVQDLNEVPQN